MSANAPAAEPRQGFTLVEVVVAMIILTVGLLGLAASSTYMAVEVRLAQLHAQRMAAVSEAAETLRTTTFASITSRAYASAITYDGYKVWWDVSAGPTVNGAVNLKIASIITQGPGYVSGHGWSTAVADTFVVSFYRPYGQ